MNHLKYVCLECGAVWGNPDADEDNISHGICVKCIKYNHGNDIRRAQLREGNWPCFGTASEECDQLSCKYRSFCLLMRTESTTPT